MALPHHRLVLILRLVAIVFGVANAGAAMATQAMGHEGIQYLDQADAWMRGDWATAINGTWSPLYPILLGMVLRVVQPSITMEFAVVHSVNFALYVGALLAFEFFWRQVSNRYHAGNDDDRLPAWAVSSIGYALFIWSTICVIRVFVVTPDMLVAALVFVSAGLLLRLTTGQATVRTAIMFGISLGGMFLARALTLPVAIVMMLFAARLLIRSGERQPLVAGVVSLVMVVAVFAIPLSRDSGGFTLGSIFRTTYLRSVLGAPFPHYGHGVPGIVGAPQHAFDISTTSPPVIRYDVGMPVTYAPIYDQGYWYAGLTPTFRPGLQARVLATNLQRYFIVFMRVQGIGLAILAVLLLVRGRRSIDPEARMLGGIGVVALALYALVGIEDRHLAPFIVLIWGAALLSVRLPAASGNTAWLRSSAIVMLAAFVINVGAFHLDGLNALVDFAPPVVADAVSSNDTGPDKATDVAIALQEHRLQPGDRIGVIGDAIHASWARLLRLRIVAEVLPGRDANAFWDGSPESRTAVLAAIEELPIRAILAVNPPSAPVPGWTRLGETHVWLWVGQENGVRSPSPLIAR